MAIEEPSVVAGASYAARLVRSGGGFRAHSDEPRMIGQIQVLDLVDPWTARFDLLVAKERVIALANEQDPVIVGLGGGAKDLEARIITDSPVGKMLIVHLIYDCRDAMGANTVNTACEAVAPLIEEITRGRVNLRILSNLADHRLARARCTVPASTLEREGFSGPEVVQRIIEAYAMAAADPYRAATHNKGIMKRSALRSVYLPEHVGAQRGRRPDGHSRIAPGRRHGRWCNQGASHGPDGSEDSGSAFRPRTGGGHRVRGAGPEPGSHSSPLRRRHSTRAHGPARATDRYGGWLRLDRAKENLAELKDQK